MPKIALVTCLQLPEPDNDADLLLECCRAAGLNAEYVAWDDPDANWAKYRLAVVRSSWNAHLHENDFKTWVTSTASATTLLNPARLMLWALKKNYLLDLQSRGVRIVPTRIIGNNDLERVLDETGWREFVMKPTVSASSYLTGRFARHQVGKAESLLEKVLSHSEAMIQPFLPSVFATGEISIICIDGEITHSVVKRPRFAEDHECVSKASAPLPEQAALARHALSAIEGPWLYARVDLMQLDSGEWALSELEVIEPSLFLTQHPEAAEQLVVAIKQRI